MARVDPEDDNIARHVVRHFAYDPARRQHRHRVIAAFDNEAESTDLVEQLSRELRARRGAGEPIDPREHCTGVFLEPGHRRRRGNARLLDAMITRGITPPRSFLADLDLPAGVGFFTSSLTEGPHLDGP